MALKQSPLECWIQSFIASTGTAVWMHDLKYNLWWWGSTGTFPTVSLATVYFRAQKDLLLTQQFKKGGFKLMQFITAQVSVNSHHHYDKLLQDAVALSKSDWVPVACKKS